MIHILCCGGRDYQDEAFVFARLDEAQQKYGDFAIIHGGARGADLLCDSYGKSKGLPVAVIFANWNFYGKKAGSLRNQWMLEMFRPDLGIAFPGGIGTANMVSQLKRNDIPVWEL